MGTGSVRDITEEQATEALVKARIAAVGNNPNLEDMEWKSTAEATPSDIVDGFQFDSNYAAKAVLSPSMSIAYKAIGGARSQEIKQEFEPFVKQLEGMRLPDTKVSLGKQRFEVPWNVTDHANTLPQKEAILLLFKFIGRVRTNELRKFSCLAGQEEKPTLWLGQKLYIESKLPYVYQIRHQPGLKEVVAGLTKEQQETASNGVLNLFGPAIYEQLVNVANSNEITPYAVFVILYHQILERERKLRKPTISSGLWDVLDEANEEARKEEVSATVQEVA